MADDAGMIKMAWDLPHAPAKVWRALTEPGLVAQWLMNTDMPSEPGKAFTFRAAPTPWWDGIVHSEILVLEPQRRLSYSWDGGPAAQALKTVVTWTLTPVAGGTRLEIEHSGFKAEQSQASAGAGLGWKRNVGERMAALLKSLN